MSTEEGNSSEKLSRILNSQLLVYPGNFTDAAQGVNNLGSNVRFKGELAEKLLLYDHVIIPTFDFSIMPVLLAWLGSNTFEELLNKNAISFIRHRGFLGYFGGRGPDVFRIEKRDQSVSSRASWIKAAFAETGEAIDAWVHNTSTDLQPKQKQRIIDKALNCTHTVQLESEDVKRILRAETYKDILESSLSIEITEKS